MKDKMSDIQPVIAAHNLSVDYRLNKVWLNAVRDITLHINPLQIHGLVGESGSGKSTLALALMNYLAANGRISSGEVLLEGDDLTQKSVNEMRQIWGSKISLVPQDALSSLNPSYTIGNQIAEVFQHHAKTRINTRQLVIDMLRRVGIADPEVVAQRYPHQLSGGMQQRVTIAMALITQPRLLVLDEPTTALDVTTQAVILDLFRDLIRDHNAAGLYVSHDLGVVAQLCDDVTVMYAGEIMESASVETLFKRPTHPYTAGLLASLPKPTQDTETRLPTMPGVQPSLADRPTGCVFAPRCPIALQLCADQKPALEIMRDGHTIRCHRWREIDAGEISPLHDIDEKITSERPPDIDYIMTAEGMHKYFDENTLWDRITRRKDRYVHAVDDADLRIRARSTLGLVGESGSGKTTLARIIVGLETADSGEMHLLEKSLANHLSARSRDLLRELQMVFQNPNDTLNPYHTVGQALARTIRRLSDKPISKQQVQERVIDLLKSVRLSADYADRYPEELSGGEKQRVAIARAFAANPALVVADEPTSALDVSVQAVILNLLKDLRAQEGASYLLISHDLAAVAYLADWIAVMYLGQIVEVGDTEDVYDAPSHPYTEALVSAIPEPDPTLKRKQIRLDGDIPSARNIPPGCRFHTRCPRYLGDICKTKAPPWRDAGDGHLIRCHIEIDELIRLQSAEEAGTV